MSVASSTAPSRAGMPRRVEPEWLDELPADDPRAVRSRRDLRRVNRLMGNASILLPEIDRVMGTTANPHLVELGAGDGSLMLQLARRRSQRWAGTRVTLIDRQPVVAAATLDAFRDLGMTAQVKACDVFDWLADPRAARVDLVIANLFVHHFDGQALKQLLHAIARSARAFVCMEPRRSRLALAGSHLLGAVGCNATTRHDAVLSVHAGFRDREITEIWPQLADSGHDWAVRETSAGLFGHLFVAVRAR